MSPIHTLTELLARLPGLGPRQARRVVQYLLSRDQAYRDTLAKEIQALAARTAQCTRCYRYADATALGLCTTCADGERDQSTLMVVEHDIDIDAIEASLTYAGQYFVLGGLMNMVKQRKEKVIRSKELIRRVNADVTEVIFALATTPEGDFTAKELSGALSAGGYTGTISLLGRGLSIGAELEYADTETLRSALKNRG